MHRFPDWSRRTAILLFWLFLWHLASLAVQNQILLVGPLDALKALAVQLASPASWGALWFSFGRISLGFFMAFLAGLLTGSLAFWKPLAASQRRIRYPASSTPSPSSWCPWPPS